MCRPMRPLGQSFHVNASARRRKCSGATRSARLAPARLSTAPKGPRAESLSRQLYWVPSQACPDGHHLEADEVAPCCRSKRAEPRSFISRPALLLLTAWLVHVLKAPDTFGPVSLQQGFADPAFQAKRKTTSPSTGVTLGLARLVSVASSIVRAAGNGWSWPRNVARCRGNGTGRVA